MKRIYKTTFHAAHHIKDHPTCGKTHGHSYRLIVKIPGNEEIFVDFHTIKKTVDRVVETYDHTDLGHMTCEKLAREILEQLNFHLGGGIEIELYETDHFGVELS